MSGPGELNTVSWLPLDEEVLGSLGVAEQWHIYVAGSKQILEAAREQGWLKVGEKPLSILLEDVGSIVETLPEDDPLRTEFADKLSNLFFLEDTRGVRRGHSMWGVDVHLSEEGEIGLSVLNEAL